MSQNSESGIWLYKDLTLGLWYEKYDSKRIWHWVYDIRNMIVQEYNKKFGIYGYDEKYSGICFS